MLRRTLRRIRYFLFALFTTALIALAVLMGLTQLAMPWLVRNPQRIEAWLSERLHQPVTIGGVNGAWIGGGPVLTLDHVRIGTPGGAKPPLEVAQAELALSLYAPFQRGRAWSEFRMIGVDVQFVHDDEGWHLRGPDLGTAAAAAPREAAAHTELSMGALGVLVLKDFKLAIDDPREDLHLSLGASEIRVINRGATTHLAGKVRNLAGDATPIDLIADVDLNRRNGIFYAGGRDIDLARFGAQRPLAGVELLTGRGDAQIWIAIAASRIDDVRVRLDLHDATLAAHDPIALDNGVAVEPRTHFDRVAFVARWLREDGGWTADVADLVVGRGDASLPPAGLTLERRGDDVERYRAQTTNLALEPIGSVVMLSSRVPEGVRRWLYVAHPQGQVAGADLRWNGAEDYDVDALLHAAGFASASFVPGVEHVDAELHGDEHALVLQLPEQALRVDYPRVFRKPFKFAQFGGDVVAYRDDAAWRIETDRITFEGEGYGGELRGGAEIQDDHTRPLLDLYAMVTHADVVAAKLFWPTNVMPPQAVQWLDRALVDGRLDAGRVLVRGDLDSWPFRDNAGRFEARGHIVDTVFDYNPEWPRAEHLSATANFVNDSMQVEAESGDVKGNRVASATASIPNFGEPVLDLSVKGDGSGANLLGFLRDTPIGKRYDDTLKDLAIGGKGDLAFTLNLPIKEPSKLALDGSVNLSEATLDDAAFNLHFVDAGGVVKFNQGGFAAGPLAVGFRQRPAKLAIAVGSYVDDPSRAVEASLVGRFPATTVFADVPDLLPALARFPGEAEWKAALTVDTSTAPTGGRKRLTLASDLRGIVFDLPEPLAKPADTAQAFDLALDLPFIGETFTAKLGTLASASGRLPSPTKPFAARVAFGGEPGTNLPERGAAITGSVSTFDAGGWLDLLQLKPGSGGGTTGGLLQGIDIGIDDFVMSRRSFGKTHLVVADNAGATELKLDGEGLLGTLSIPGKDLARQGVTANFERFHWPTLSPDAAEQDDASLIDVAPATLPPLHFAVADFALGQASFGAAQFESYPTADGMHVDKLESHSPNVNMTASGDWTGTAQSNRSHLQITLTAQNLGHMMDALGFPGLIDGGQTTADIDAIWPGPPSAFALAKMETGAITLKVAEGRILEVDPGAGRFFGLFSLSEIPRRLSLDFSDFFRSGLSFNSITGTFGLDKGNAYTSDLLIKSPAADIAISGRTGLRAKDYDQEMVVSPHTGVTLPIVGALAAGPVGAAAGLVLQGVLGKPMGKAMGSHYKVTGSWEKPTITLVSRETPRQAPRDAKSPADAPAPAPPQPQPAGSTQPRGLR
ncbi:MAG TPA: YhdP family protein [Rhodanobacteraceae bacterium]|nr:YhdP family protein [Rhodanobacteraceae bacterium]